MLEGLVLLGTFGSMFLIGILSVVSESRSNKKASKWALPPANIEKSNQLFQPIDEASKYVVSNKLMEEPITHEENWRETDLAINTFTHSQITDEVDSNLNILMESVNQVVNEYTESGNDSSLTDGMKEKIKNLVGERTSKLVTHMLTELQENELSVILGLHNANENTLSFEGSTISLSTIKEIVAGPDDFILLKGTLLPTGEFRVLHFDDAETVEMGYHIESFILPKIA